MPVYLDQELPECPADSIFVFGSNTAGQHGKGAALWAKRYKGAIDGVGEGLHGMSYAIPTRSYNKGFIETLPLKAVELGVTRFIEFARRQPELRFFVTRVGCGLAGFRDEQIAPLFKDAPENCDLPDGWR
jgi:hypothetical protein